MAVRVTLCRPSKRGRQAQSAGKSDNCLDHRLPDSDRASAEWLNRQKIYPMLAPHRDRLSCPIFLVWTRNGYATEWHNSGMRRQRQGDKPQILATPPESADRKMRNSSSVSVSSW